MDFLLLFISLPQSSAVFSYCLSNNRLSFNVPLFLLLPTSLSFFSIDALLRSLLKLSTNPLFNPFLQGIYLSLLFLFLKMICCNIELNNRVFQIILEYCVCPYCIFIAIAIYVELIFFFLNLFNQFYYDQISTIFLVLINVS